MIVESVTITGASEVEITLCGNEGDPVVILPMDVQTAISLQSQIREALRKKGISLK